MASLKKDLFFGNFRVERGGGEGCRPIPNHLPVPCTLSTMMAFHAQMTCALKVDRISSPVNLRSWTPLSIPSWSLCSLSLTWGFFSWFFSLCLADCIVLHNKYYYYCNVSSAILLPIVILCLFVTLYKASNGSVLLFLHFRNNSFVFLYSLLLFGPRAILATTS